VKFEDLDGDGQPREPDEPGLPDWTIYVDYNDNDIRDAIEPYAVTGNNGRYTIGGIRPGIWKVREELQEGWTNTYPPSGYYEQTFVAGQTETGLDFGNFERVTLVGRKFNDLDGGGTDNGGTEPGQGGVTINLYRDANGNGTLELDTDTLVDSTTTTPVTGVYSFDDLGPGTYFVQEIVPNGWTPTAPLGPNYYSVTATSGGIYTGRDFGNFADVTIHGRKFNDLDGDGTDNGGTEPGQGGVTINLYQDANGNGTLDMGEDTFVDSTVTDTVTGNYAFDDLGPGTYFVQETVSAGSSLTVPLNPDYHIVAAVSGGEYAGRDFGNFVNVPILGRKFNDLDGDGTDNGGAEPGQGGVTINLYRDANGNMTLEVGEDTFLDSTVTDTVTGNYAFDDLGPGTYFVQETVPAGSTLTMPLNPNYHIVTAISGGEYTGRDFGNFVNVSILGRKFNDLDGDGTDNGGTEPGQGGVTINLYQDANGNGTLDVGEDTFVDSIVTDTVTGNYAFDDLGPGTYFVQETVPAGSSPTVPLNPDYHIVAAVSGGEHAGRDFGNFVNVSILGRKFNDLDGDGTDNDGTEPGQGGVTINLYRDANGNGTLDVGEDTFVDSTVTDTVTGNYAFDDLGPGTYFVQETVSAGSTLTMPLNPNYHIVTAISGGEYTGRDFGNFVNVSILGRKFNDLDGDGTDNGGTEPGQGGVTINLYRDANGNGTLEVGEDTFVDSTVTDTVAGNYAFDDLGPGIYFVQETMPAGSTLTVPLNPNYHIVTAISGGEYAGRDFGNFADITLRGRKFHDLNRDGSDNGGTDPGLAGWTIRLDLNSDGTVDRIAVTDADGRYEFPAVGPGTHTLSEVLQTGWVQTAPQPVPPGGYVVNAQSGQNRTDLDFGNGREPPALTQVVQFITPISAYRQFEGLFEPQPVEPPTNPQWIEGYLWQDSNQNGIWEQGEDGRKGWFVYLDLNKNGVWDGFPADVREPFAVTDANGRFVFDVEPGTYHLRVDVGNLDLSDGAFLVLSFPGTDVHVIELKAGQPVIGASGPTIEPTVPNFGFFVYSPFIRPADDHVGRILQLDAASKLRNDLLTALEPWQSFTITNTTGAPFEITEIQKNIDTSRVPVADQFVTVYLKQGNNLIAVAPADPQQPESQISVDPPILVANGQSVQFFAFYDPAIREGARVVEQYPDWYGANKHTHPAHTFTRDDHLNVLTDTTATFRVDFVGGSTYDSDIFYDGAVEPADFGHLDALLSLKTIDQKLYIPFGDDLFDPTADINARCPNEAAGVHATCAWPLLDLPPREVGLGDFGPLNIEWNRARAPFLDLDPDNSSGAKGADYKTKFPGDRNPMGESIHVADSDSQFANLGLRVLAEVSFRITPDSRSAGDRLLVDQSQLPDNIVIDEQPYELRLVGNPVASVQQFNTALQLVMFHTSLLTPRTVNIEIWATGAVTDRSHLSFTKLAEDWELAGNIALARIVVEPVGNADVAHNVSFEVPHGGESESSDASQAASVAVPAAMALTAWKTDDLSGSNGSEGANSWQNRKNRYDVNGDSLVTPLDALLIVNYLDASPASKNLPPRTDTSQPYLDVNADGHGTALDALLVINHLSPDEVAAGEGEAAGMLAEPPRNENLSDGADAQIGSLRMPPQAVAVPIAFDLERDLGSANDWLDLTAPSEPIAIVPPVGVDQPNTPIARVTSLADDDSEDLEAAVLDVEGLLADLVDDIAAAGLW